MSALVLMHHEQPMTTSLAIAEGVQLSHENVIRLIRKYVEDISEFGSSGFEIQKGGELHKGSDLKSDPLCAGVAFEMLPFDTAGGRQWREIAYLNEPQATLLLTFMRNSPVVIEFKKALVRAFFELRDRAVAGGLDRSDPLNMSHRADIAVSAGRTFGAWERIGRRLGLSRAQAIRLANEKTVQATGIDVIAEAGYQDAIGEVQLSSPVRFVMAWLAGSLDLPVICCAGADLYRCYCEWCRSNAEPWPASHVVFSREIKGVTGMVLATKAVRSGSGGQRTARVVMPDADQPDPGMNLCDWLAMRLPEFSESLEVSHG